MLESQFQSKLIKRLKSEFPGIVILKNDPNYIQGMPDLTLLYKNKWAMLECKKSITASHQPNQDYYIRNMSQMSYAAFVAPENVEEVLNELRDTFRT